MKAYPLTETELTHLGLIQGGATLLFSLAAAMVGFWLNVTQSIAFTSDLSESAKAFWDALRWCALVGAIVLAIIAGGLVYLGWSAVGKIKKETDHGEKPD